MQLHKPITAAEQESSGISDSIRALMQSLEPHVYNSQRVKGEKIFMTQKDIYDSFSSCCLRLMLGHIQGIALVLSLHHQPNPNLSVQRYLGSFAEQFHRVIKREPLPLMFLCLEAPGRTTDKALGT